MSGDTEFIYGVRPVEEAIAGPRAVHRVLRTPETPASELESLAGSPDHQGIVAEVDVFEYGDGNEVLGEGDALIVVLDQIQDPRNLGAVCRSAEAAGARAVVIPERRAASITPAARKASAGAVEHLPVCRVRNIADWLGDARDAGFWIWGASGEGERTPWETDLTGRTVLVMGAEGKGLRPRVTSACDGLVAIPQTGRIDSLNVSAAATALLFEAVRQRLQS